MSSQVNQSAVRRIRNVGIQCVEVARAELHVVREPAQIRQKTVHLGTERRKSSSIRVQGHGWLLILDVLANAMVRDNEAVRRRQRRQAGAG